MYLNFPPSVGPRLGVGIGTPLAAHSNPLSGAGLSSSAGRMGGCIRLVDKAGALDSRSATNR